MKNTFRIAEISFGRSQWNAAYEFDYQGYHFVVQRYGANINADNAKALIEKLRTQVDAFALTSVPPVVRLDEASYVHREYLDIVDTPCSVPICDGNYLREICNLLSLTQLIKEKKLTASDGVFFPSALMAIDVEEYLRAQGETELYFGDAYNVLGLPVLVKPFFGLKSLSKFGLNVANMKKLKSTVPIAATRFGRATQAGLLAQLQNVRYVIGDLPYLTLFESTSEFLRGKDVIVWSHHEKLEEELLKYEPRTVTSLMPEAFRISPYINYGVLDAVLRLANHKTASLDLEEWQELLDGKLEGVTAVNKYLRTRKASRQVQMTRVARKIKKVVSREKEPDFAFIVHALSHRDFERVPVVGKVIEQIPKDWTYSFDKMVSKAPPIVYGHVRHVISEANGREINGIIYGLWSTPKVLKNTPPEVTYAQIEKICYDAYHRGAKMIGLGAYTKVIGDSGITINRNSPIPVTTGNSLSTSATLWALLDVVIKMRLIKGDAENKRFDGVAMVIGATGSIGSASAKLMARVFRKMILVAPRLERLEDLKKEVQVIAPDCEIVVATDANVFASEVDVLVTATSAFDQKIIDVMNLKPGCVVCDCSRPLDFTPEDAKKRPDVLIIESGEVVLPGPYTLGCDLGLPGNTVYACLGETALLTLEGRYEPFTMGRDIDWIKVKEIYKMAVKHGVKLAAIQGHMGTITDREIELTVELAKARLRDQGQ